MITAPPTQTPAKRLAPDLQRILDYVRDHPRCRSNDIFHGISLTWDQTHVQSKLRDLVKRGLLIRHDIEGSCAKSYTVTP